MQNTIAAIDHISNTVISIPKDPKGDLCANSNYRGIVLISSIGKVMDHVLLRWNTDKLQTSELQFAYKDKHSTVMCSMALKEVIQHYITNESKVAACFLDSCKAFDRVRHDKLFHLLMQRPISPVDLRVLYQQYKLQLSRLEWNGLH